jgi:hypothetical protein
MGMEIQLRKRFKKDLCILKEESNMFVDELFAELIEESSALEVQEWAQQQFQQDLQEWGLWDE